MVTPEKIFNERVHHFNKLHSQLQSRYNLWATLRVVIFLAFIIMVVVFADQRAMVSIALSTAVFIVLFALIVKKHSKIKFNRNHTSFLKLINSYELERKQGLFDNVPDGSIYKDPLHAYANDLDLFGKSSLFQLLNRTSTKIGADKLASWLLQKASHEEILLRQGAVQALSTQIDWRQYFQAYGLHHTPDEKQSQTAFIEWISSETRVSRGNQWVSYGMPILNIASLILAFAGVLPWFVVLLCIAVSSYLLKRFNHQINDLSEAVSLHIKTLNSYSLMLQHIEQSSFDQPLLSELKNNVNSADKSASSSIRKLYKILDVLNSRSNMLYQIINAILLYDIHILRRCQKWKYQTKDDVADWFDTIASFEALNSLAAFTFAHPAFIFPEIANDDFQIEVTDLGHPLIAPDERISNSFAMSGKGAITIITGSNMSGKSTFLRTLGVNIVLAQCGAVVCASHFKCSLVQVFTSMRTQDSLSDHISSFYAELKRIETLIAMVAESEPVFYILDEILKGTNSDDRQLGAKSLAQQLTVTNSFGLISTHDLALGEMAKQHGLIQNYSFNSIVDGDKIFFPYKLEKGICHSFNASALMEKIGIKIKKGL